MKTINILALAVAINCVPQGGHAADSRPAKASANTQPPAKAIKATKPEPSKKVPITGSYIKQEVRRKGQITDAASQVLVLDNKSVENSGASDLRQLLIRQGVNH